MGDNVGDVEIRLLTAADWQAFRDIRLRALADAPAAFGSTLESAQARTERDWRELLAGRAQFLASVDGVDVGTAAGLDDPERAGAHLISMWVAGPARGTGVSDLLLRAVIDWAVGVGHQKVWLEVAMGNVAAEQLYLRQGFVRTGVEGLVAPGDPRPEFEMLLEL
ncbi:GNAT family N-acetyltransferase [Nocardia sp. NBC_00565]|uniref:GNAT family N-acetyltransferase n=1 Tax=Nocardia sp. NBC_00565 TaxID=2975993 RepID=UPI002E80DB44|nr:GNAT family N-acetyltransferase [Nocardia sp. NBC_00565]WUC02282.1 GNAT family N-acetyltransferase [Nocardia sp. NBC_00565]